MSFFQRRQTLNLPSRDKKPLQEQIYWILVINWEWVVCLNKTWKEVYNFTYITKLRSYFAYFYLLHLIIRNMNLLTYQLNTSNFHNVFLNYCKRIPYHKNKRCKYQFNLKFFIFVHFCSFHINKLNTFMVCMYYCVGNLVCCYENEGALRPFKANYNSI